MPPATQLNSSHIRFGIRDVIHAVVFCCGREEYVLFDTQRANLFANLFFGRGRGVRGQRLHSGCDTMRRCWRAQHQLDGSSLQAIPSPSCMLTVDTFGSGKGFVVWFVHYFLLLLPSSAAPFSPPNDSMPSMPVSCPVVGAGIALHVLLLPVLVKIL